ncbi:MAG: biopolymer transporter ExbD [Proteobacteria bacterium]|nr:biopolymer transporter ExbD [Pseudomonadota bacterium]MBU4066890.1 biopolymer transporter ExbD [Pseudomonadota bacterium]MBU4099813.1 biopolymer transporter ExbD [Pseudomonadota bacterium]MBU4126357.1 biopolymer transporter ExbD [Pseudomonadota bacterium]
MKLNINVHKSVRIEMLPLIDIVFLLLVFFIYAMLSMAVHRGLPVLLPASSTAEIEKKSALSVTVRTDGTIYVDEKQISIENLAAFLKKKAEIDKDTGILLFADNSLLYQELFRVLDQIRIAGLNRISLQSEAEQQP